MNKTTHIMYLLKNIIYVLCMSSLVVALEDDRIAQVKHYEFQNDGTGPYRFSFETSNGIKRDEEGDLVHANTDHAAVVVKGTFSYFGPDGVEYKVKYTADENGFHPEGDHFKVPPFVPWIHHHHDDGHDHHDHDHHDHDHHDYNDNGQGQPGTAQLPIQRGEKILDAYQSPRPTAVPQVYEGNPVRPTTRYPYGIQPIKQTSYPAPFRQATPTTYPTPTTFRGYPPSTIKPVYSSRYTNPALRYQNSYTTPTPPPTQYLSTPKTTTFQRLPQRPNFPIYSKAPVTTVTQAYLPSTPSPKPVAYVPENIEKTQELTRTNEGNRLLEQLETSRIYIPSSTPKSVEITVHSEKPLDSEVNHI